MYCMYRTGTYLYTDLPTWLLSDCLAMIAE